MLVSEMKLVLLDNHFLLEQVYNFFVKYIDIFFIGYVCFTLDYKLFTISWYNLFSHKIRNVIIHLKVDKSNRKCRNYFF